MSNKTKKLKTLSTPNVSVMIEDSSFVNSKNFDSLSKKITIKDLCPEEKLKIGELLKKLAEEKEAKEKLSREIEEEKRNYLIKLESISKEKDNLSISNLNNSSFCLKSETFTENFIGRNSNTKQNDNCVKEEIKNLREKFNNMIDKIKQSASKQEDFLNRISTTKSEFDFAPVYDKKETRQSLLEISTNSSMLREEQPLNLEIEKFSHEFEETSKPNTNIDNDFKASVTKNFSPKIYDMTNLEQQNQLQTSIININQEIRDNHYEKNSHTTESIIKSFNLLESFKTTETSSSPKKSNSYFLSTKKLNDLKNKLYQNENNLNLSNNWNNLSNNNISQNDNYTTISDNNPSNQNIFKYNRESSYKQMLNRVREKSQEQAKRTENVIPIRKAEENKVRFKITPNCTNKFLVSSNENDFQIISNYSSRFVERFQEKSLNDSYLTKTHFENEDEQLIFILNTNSSKKSDLPSLRKKQELKESSIDLKSEFYEENLFDLIEEIESKDRIRKENQQIESHPTNTEISFNQQIDYEIDKKIHLTMKEVEEEINKINQMNRTNNLDKVSANRNTKYKENLTKTKENHTRKKNTKFQNGKNIYENINMLNFKYSTDS